MMTPQLRSFLAVGAQAAGADGIGGRHTLSQGDPQLGVQGCDRGTELAQQQPGLVAVNVAIHVDSAQASALFRRLSASR